MSIWLFQDLGLEDPKQDFERYIKLLNATVGGFGADLYFPMVYFEEQSKEVRTGDAYAEKLKDIREEIFSVREQVADCKTLESLAGMSHSFHTRFEVVYNDLLFMLATMPEKDRWIGSCDIHKNVGGLMKSYMNEMCTLLHLLRHLETKCKREIKNG